MAKRTRSKGTGSLFQKSGRGSWIASYYDHAGKRREHSTRTTDLAAAERILTKLVADTALRRDLVIDPRDDRFAAEGRKALTEHVGAYITHCRHAGHAPHYIAQKKSQLEAMIVGSKATRLAELTADALELHLTALKDRKLSARSVNFARQIAVAFCSWCVRTGRAASNPLIVVPKQDETRDRRRVRRALTDNEMAALLAVATERGRDAWYLAAAMAGLRKGDLQRLCWRDVDFTEGTLTIRQGKAKRDDVIPMHPQLAEALRRRLEAKPAVPIARVWSDTVTDATRRSDFKRAKIKDTDAEGRIVDLHALRTTLGTQLARAGVAPQLAQRVMRHSDYRTTLKHYTILGLADSAKTIAQLPSVGIVAHEANAATGTTDTPPADPQRYPQQSGRETGKQSATPCVEAVVGDDAPESNKPQQTLRFSRHSAGITAKRATRLERATFSLEG